MAQPDKRPLKIKVKGGETMEMIAKRWKVSVPAIMMENNLVSDQVRPGQTLKLPQLK
jgi:LysM repeat protein